MNTASTPFGNQDLGNLFLGNQIWQKCQEDPELGEAPEAVKEVLGEFINYSPTILKDQLFDPVSLKSIMDAKLAFLRYCQENNLIQRVVVALPEENLGWMSRGSMAKSMASTFGKLIDLAENISYDIIGFLEEREVTEEFILTSPESDLCLNEKLQEGYRAGTLTICDLLLEQPTVILKNS